MFDRSLGRPPEGGRCPGENGVGREVRPQHELRLGRPLVP